MMNLFNYYETEIVCLINKYFKKSYFKKIKYNLILLDIFIYNVYK